VGTREWIQRSQRLQSVEWAVPGTPRRVAPHRSGIGPEAATLGTHIVRFAILHEEGGTPLSQHQKAKSQALQRLAFDLGFA
jgi:hypothetical protein